MTGSQIFHPYRAMGRVANDIPFVLQKRGRKDNFVTVSVGNSFQIFNCKKLHLAFVSPMVEQSIRALAAYKDYTFTAHGSRIGVWTRAKQVDTLEGHEAAVQHLFVFGDHLLSVGADQKAVLWDLKEMTKFSEFPLPDNFTVTCVMHPDTYLNKILLGSEEGDAHLWNLRTQDIIYKFESLGGTSRSAITCIAQSPAVDVVGIGREDGSILIFNLKFDKTLFTLHQQACVTSLSFRTDGHPMLASASVSGAISVWNLEQRNLVTVDNRAHHGMITKIEFLAGEPLLLSAGDDNALKMWIYDQEDGSGRVLRHRDGHRAPVTRVRHYGADGKQLLSAAHDGEFRFQSTIQDRQSRALSTKAVLARNNKRMLDDDKVLTQVLDMAWSIVRDRDWECLVTIHLGDTDAYTWSVERKAIGPVIMPTTQSPPSPLQAVEVSMCGNFCFLGNRTGFIDVYNVQSGFHRGVYIDSENGLKTAHTGGITGLKSDALNMFLISAGLEGKLKFWNFRKRTLLHTLSLGAAVNQLELHRESNLLAASCDNLVISIVDIEAQNVVRRIRGHSNRITDMTFSRDARWLLSASMDCTLRVWDLPTSTMVDWCRFSTPVTSLSLSPTSDFLATSHVNSEEVYLWANRFLYGDVKLGAIGEHPPMMALPGLARPQADADGDDSMEAVSDGDSSSEDEVEEEEMQLDDKLITLADIPPVNWQTLPNIDIIRKREKPKETQVEDVQAPFFLPTLPGLEPKFIPTAEMQEEEARKQANGGGRQSRLVSMKDLRPQTAFNILLDQAEESGDYTRAMQHLMGMSASGVDVVIQSLSPANDFADLKLFLAMIQQQVEKNINFEVSQAYLHRFLQVHADIIAADPDLLSRAQDVHAAQEDSWGRLETLIQSNMCVLGYVSSIQHAQL
eukprot:TRINITY_DN32910_c0_g1_i1.p1 TRINITY_DN32910_c0_g1~~TRINITY_DN32910_c0_g1_i1.p1  ORF type:complete len:904 (-),score=197.62 TRINITY_DN32910_c0_g1_i1:61-2772(-)